MLQNNIHAIIKLEQETAHPSCSNQVWDVRLQEGIIPSEKNLFSQDGINRFTLVRKK